MMPIRSAVRLLLLSALVTTLCTGCITRRTVTDDGNVVSSKLVVTTPFSNP